MTPKELAKKVVEEDPNDPGELGHDFLSCAAEHRMVILFGASDDLLEVRGLVCDEAGAYNGRTARLCPDGFLGVSEDGILRGDVELVTVSQCRQVVEAWDSSIPVTAEWQPERTGLTWRISSDCDLPKAEFPIFVGDIVSSTGLIIQFPEP